MALIVGGTKKAASALRWLWPAWASAMIAAITVMALVTGVLPGQRLVVADDATSGLAFRSQVGRVATFVCPSTLLANGTIWGTDRYLDESPVCTAAIHAGALTRGTSAQVTILMSADGQSFRGTARNGVTSLNYGPWESSYTFVKTGQPGQIDWATTLDRIPDDFRTPIKLSCPPKGSTDFEVSGTDVYTSQSAICVAAVHAGVITRDGGGAISVIPVVKQASFPATTRNGVTTTSWVDPIWQSYPQPFRVASISTAVRVPTSAPAVGTVGAVAPVPAGRRGMPAAAVLDDATAPTVTVTTVPAGLQISYDLVPGAINYVLCRESPPASTLCDPITTGGVSVLGNTASQFDLGLTPGSAYAYRVRAIRSSTASPSAWMPSSLVSNIRIRPARFSSSHPYRGAKLEELSPNRLRSDNFRALQSRHGQRRRRSH